ncbi:MAG: hypothetical protein WBA41_10195 [Rivularia sp. (in: cyanobacteria)]
MSYRTRFANAYSAKAVLRTPRILVPSLQTGKAFSEALPLLYVSGGRASMQGFPARDWEPVLKINK